MSLFGPNRLLGFREVAFGFDRGLAAHACGGDGLAVHMVRAVARYVNAGNGGPDLAAVFREEVAIGVNCDRVSERSGIGNMSDGDEDAFAVNHADCIGLAVLDADAAHIAGFVSFDFFDKRVPSHFDFFVTDGSVGHDLGGSQLVATMNQRDLATKAREENGFFAGSIATADNDDIHIAIEGSIAGRAGGDSLAAEHFLFARNSQQTWRGSSRDDDGARFVFLVRGFDRVGGLGEVDRFDETLFEAGTEFRGLLTEVIHQHEAVDALWKSGEILDFARLRELSPWQVTFDYERVQIGSGRVDCGSETGTTGAYDDDVFDFSGHGNGLEVLRVEVGEWQKALGLAMGE